MASHLENTKAVDKITYMTDAVPTWWMFFWIGFILFMVAYIVFDWIPDFLGWMNVVGQGPTAADQYIWLRELMRN